MSGESNSEIDAALRVENILAQSEFAELLELAIDMCFTDRSVYDAALARERQKTSQADQTNIALAEKIGTWGLKVCLEAPENPWDSSTTTDEGEPLYLIEELFIRQPEYSSLPPRRDVQEKITAFGVALLEEAFTCLGPDAEEQVEKFRSVTKGDEGFTETRAGVIDWLVTRINDIANSENADTLDQDRFKMEIDEGQEEKIENMGDEPIEITITPKQYLHYHPARVSPKMMGEYPNMVLKPTCLSASLLVAAFINKLDIAFMHGAVIQGSDDTARWTILGSAAEIVDKAESISLNLPDEVKDKLNNVGDSAYRGLQVFIGYHALVMADLEIQNNEWLQIDPYMHTLAFYHPLSNEKVNNLYNTLRESDATYGTSGILSDNASKQGWMYYDVLKKMAAQERDVNDEADWLRSLDPATTTIDTYADHLLEVLTNTPDIDNIDAITHYVCDYEEVDMYDFVQKALRDTIREYVFTDIGSNDDVTKTSKRLVSDEAYLQRRAEDLFMAPFYALLKMQLSYTNAAVKKGFPFPHTVVEAGLPEYRIGASVLNEIALYSGDDLPLNWWLTYWPDRMALLTRAERLKDISKLQAHRARDVMAYLHGHTLIHFAIDDKIGKFLEQDERLEGGEPRVDSGTVEA